MGARSDDLNNNTTLPSATSTGYIFDVYSDSTEALWRLEGWLEEGRIFTAIARNDAKARQVALVCLQDRGTVGGASLMIRSGQATTLDRRYRFSNHITFSRLPLAELRDHIPSRYRSHVGPGYLPPATWRHVMLALLDLRPDHASELIALQRLAEAPDDFYYDPAYDTISMEKDAVGLALNLSGIDREEVLHWAPTPIPAPFLQGLAEVRQYEDLQIVNDAHFFPGMTYMPRGLVVGAAEFYDDSNRLTVINVNRTNIEATTGVDLIYYNHNMESYVMVQYKRMTKDETHKLFRPAADPNLKSELDRMRALQVQQCRQANPTTYRLHAGSCFLKLCDPTTFDAASKDLIRGMYYPLEYWDLIMTSDATLGPRGGRIVTYDKPGRYLTNTLFTLLVQGGWIGSRDVATDSLSKLIADGLDASRSVTLARSG